MNNLILKVSSFLLIPGLCCVSVIGNYQDLKLTKKELKEAKKTEKSKNFEALGTFLESRKFLFESNIKKNREGLTVAINPSINYFKVDSLSINMNFETAGLTWMTNVAQYFNSQPKEGDIYHWELLKNSEKFNYYLTLRANIDYPFTSTFSFTVRIYADKSAMVRLNSGRKSDFNEFHGKIKAF
jgi:hypothetical protein